MKRLIVCGDSYMSPRVTAPGTHFSEIFAKKLKFDLTVYARSAMSNGGIILQLEQAILDKPDLILFNTSSHERIEFVINDTELNHHLKLLDLKYDTYETDLSSITNQFNGLVVSDNLVSLLSDPKNYAKTHGVPLEKMEATKLFFKELYCSVWKHQMDLMMMYYITHKLHLSGIPFILCHDLLGLQKFFKVDWLNEKNSVTKEIDCYLGSMTSDQHDYGYHTTPETQIKIAFFMIDHYNKYFKPVV